MHEENKKSSRISRREFALQAALGTATAACLPGDLLLARPLISQPESAQEIKLSPASQAEVDAKIQAILRKYGDRLSEAQKADIHRLVTESQAPLEKMRAFPLDNDDHSGNVFQIYHHAAACSAPEPSR